MSSQERLYVPAHEVIPPCDDEVNQFEDKHLQSDGGVFVSKPNGINVLPLPVYDTEVDTTYRKKIRTESYHGLGSMWLEEWQMSDGIRYDVLMAEPSRPKTDVPVVKDTAWGTQVTGFNEDIAQELMALGLPVVIKGPEKGGSIPLSHSAHNTHKVLDITEHLGHHKEGVVAVEGYSRGAMIGFGTSAYAARNGREVIYSNLTDPCLARPVRFTPRQLIEMSPDMKDIPTEFLTMATQIGRLMLNPAKLLHYRDTINFSVDGVKQFHQTGKPLFTGEAGYLARHFPLDSQATVCFFGNSFANHQREFKEILKNHDGVEFKQPRGGHMQGMDKRILGNIAARFSGLVAQLQDGVPHRDIDYSLVHKTVKA